MLNRKLILQILFVLLLCAVPLRIIKTHYDPDHTFLKLIYFGEVFEERSLPEVREIDPPRTSHSGYDAQFYAQLALRPSLEGEDLVAAIDNASYRSHRIGLPLLAYLLGAGQPNVILQILALLNLAFWFLLLGVLWKTVGFSTARDCLLAISLLWSTGSLISVTRSLTDFPATVLGVMALLMTVKWWVASLMLAGAGMIKETSIISFSAIPLENRSLKSDLTRIIYSGFIVAIPIGLWLAYTLYKIPYSSISGARVFSVPFVGVCKKILIEFQSFIGLAWGEVPVSPLSSLFELLCPLSMLAQAVYLSTHVKLNSALWRFGIGFAVLFLFLGDAVWEEQIGYSRIYLPLTFSFNLLVHKHEKNRAYRVWYLLGNVGMCSIVLSILSQLAQL